jgi:hypothetical protein
VAGAFQDAEVGAPGAYDFAVLVGHHAGDLVEMGEVMGGPGAEELGERNYTEGGVAAAAVEISGLNIQSAEGGKVGGADAGKFIEQLREGFALDFLGVTGAIEGHECLGFAGLQDHFDARDPVSTFAVNQVGDDLEGAPGVFAFVAMGPGFVEVAEKCVERGGGAGEKRHYV